MPDDVLGHDPSTRATAFSRGPLLGMSPQRGEHQVPRLPAVLAAQAGALSVGLHERVRLARAYAARDAADVDHIAWSSLRPEAHWLEFSLQRFLFSSLVASGWTPQTIARCHVLEVGCGTGRILGWLHQAGVRQLWGIDALPHRVGVAAAARPFAQVTRVDLVALPFPDSIFDCVVEITTFSSCLDAAVRRGGANEMLRVLKPGGCVLWCDFKPGKREAAYIRESGAQNYVRSFPARP